MKTSSLAHLMLRWLCAFALLAVSGWAAADPPSRVARLAYVSGQSSFSPAGEREWVRPVVNRPLVTGDRLWLDRGGRAELQIGIAAVRLGGQTSMRLLNLDDRVTQVELTQGTLHVNVRRLDRGQIFEVDTPNLAFSIRRPGLYRVDVDADDQITTVTVRSGQGAVFGEGRAFVVGERRSWRFYDTGLRDYEFLSLPPFDELDRWAAERERRWQNGASRRYVSAEMIGYEDLDQYGTWRKVPDYGFVWTPRRVPANWAPYREGHWAWVEPWGWTWVDDAPWGFAPSHYGRWAWVDRSWVWVPGPAKARPVYAPALVAFVGGESLRAGGGNATVAWFPLGPREVYRPAYPVSREYFVNVNTSNAVVNTTVVTNLYATRDSREQANVTYSNRQIPGAVVAVLAAAFAQSRPVARETLQVNREALARAQITPVAPVAPVHASIAGPAVAGARPPEKVETRAVVAQTPPPPPPVPFAARQSALAAQPGKPLAPSAVAALKPAPAASAPAVAPAVKVVKPTEAVAAPPPPPPASRAAASAARAAAPQPGASQPGAPSPRPAPPAAASAPPAAAAAASASPRPERPGRAGERGERATERAAAPAPAPTASAAPPVVAPTAPAAAARPAPAAPAASAPSAAAPAPFARPAPEAARPAQRASEPVPAARPAPMPSRAPAAAAPASAAPAAAAPQPSPAERPDAGPRTRDERAPQPKRDEPATPPGAAQERKPPAASAAQERQPPAAPPARAGAEERKPPAAAPAAVPPPPAAAAAKPATSPAAPPAAPSKQEPPAAAAPPPPPAPRAERAAPPGPPAFAASRPRPAAAEGRARGPREAASEPAEAGRAERRP